MTKRTDYLSYLLRMWQTSDGEKRTWCASLEQPGTRGRRGFASLDELFDFLRDQIADQPGQTGGDTEDTAYPGKEKQG